MHFICSVSDLMNGLTTCTKALAGKTTNEILECVLLETDDNAVILTCSDERITIITRIQAEIRHHGRGLLNGKLFSEIVRRMSSGSVEIKMSDTFGFQIKSSSLKMNIAGRDADLFPALPRVNSEQEVALPQDTLKKMIQKTEFAISPENPREILMGCYLEIRNGDINMVALDGFRMALCREKISDVVDQFSAIIPGRAIGEIGKLLSDEADAFAQLSMGGNKLHIRLEQTDIYVILVEGDYINYRQIIPSDFSTTIRINMDDFHHCVDRASLFAREGGNNLLLMRVEDNVLTVEAHSQVGDFHEELEIEQQGGDIRIAFNVRYLNEVVRYMECDEIEMNMKSAISPCIVTPVDDKNYMHMVMPVRTNATNA